MNEHSNCLQEQICITSAELKQAANYYACPPMVELDNHGQHRLRKPLAKIHDTEHVTLTKWHLCSSLLSNHTS